MSEEQLTIQHRLVRERHAEIVYFIKCCLENMQKEGLNWEEATRAVLLDEEELYNLVKSIYDTPEESEENDSQS